jgi:acetyl-CoA carboxylase biotin carboxyl carrier protein
MDLNYLRKLVRLLEGSTLNEIEIEEDGLHVRVAKSAHPHVSATTSPAAPVVHPIAHAPAAASPAPAPVAAAPAPSAEAKYHEVKSPIVGTFYRAPTPEASPFVEVGQVVQVKSVLCIIEAMKLMNEIESDAAGRIVKILVENGQPVEYNQSLFLIEPV